MSKQLTTRQQELLDFLRAVHHSTGLMPSTREIQSHFGFASQTAAVTHLRALERKGVIQRLAGKARAVIFPEELVRDEIVDIPLYGQIPAGMPSDTQEEPDASIAIDVSTLGVSRRAQTFALRVRGESMIDAHICDGDTVILEVKEPRAGDIVAALIDGETTLKRYSIQKGMPFLHAENEDYPDLIPAQELLVQGVMVMLMRTEGCGTRRRG